MLTKKTILHLLLIVVFLSALCITLVLSCKSTPTTTKYKWTGITYSGEETPFLTGTRWAFLSNIGQRRYVEFQSGGKMIFGDWDSIYLTWHRDFHDGTSNAG